MKQEVREPAIYNAVITAIATGASKISEISTKVGETSSTCVAYVKNLVALGIVRKEVPYGEKSTKKTIYSIEDNMFRFWYRFVPENSSIISRGAVELAYSRIAPYLSDYMGAVFGFVPHHLPISVKSISESPFSNLFHKYCLQISSNTAPI